VGVTAVKSVVNNSGTRATIYNRENSGSPGHGLSVDPGGAIRVDMWIPWCTRATDFRNRHIDVLLDVDGRPVLAFSIWQGRMKDGDRVRYSTDGRFADPGKTPLGIHAVDGDRRLTIVDRNLIALERPRR
jgi:hypothetical protein